MRHSDYKELLRLSFCDELNEEERRVLDEHVKGCDECLEEVEELRKLGTLLHGGQRFEISEQLLDEARLELRVALRLEQSKRRFWSQLVDQLDVLTSPALRFALGSAAMIVVGLAAGYLLFKPSEATGVAGFTQAVGRTSEQSTGPTITNFKFIGQPLQGSDVEFTFDVVTPVHMKGSVNDAGVQRVLAQALMSDQNPGARLRTVSAIVEQGEALKSTDTEIKTALLDAVKSDPNVGVRKQALQALKRFPLDGEVKDALIFILKNEENPGIRIEAIAYLQSPEFSRQLVDKNLLDVLKEKMQSDNNNYVRTRAKHFYEEVQQL
ncbi:MAG: HEAT repeat domain-containing protein [Ignavibacteriales bacterium]|nr:HEAT repeat domain-containing protein [Ignavibacteriales bacterium]